MLGLTGLAGGSCVIDPYRLWTPNDLANMGIRFCDPGGRTQVSPVLTPGENTAVIVLAGQSVTGNTVNAVYTVTQAKNHTFCFCNGGVYQTADPVLGAATAKGANNRGAWCARLGDLLISNGDYDRVIIANMAVGGTTVANWNTSGMPPGFKDTIAVMARRLASVGLSATHVVWGQGENDTADGTSQASYTASLNGVIAEFMAQGITCPFFVAQESMLNGSTSSAVRAAQAAVVDNVNVFALADFDTIGTGSRWDNTHFTATGADSAAALARIGLTA